MERVFKKVSVYQAWRSGTGVEQTAENQPFFGDNTEHGLHKQ